MQLDDYTDLLEMERDVIGDTDLTDEKSVDLFLGNGHIGETVVIRGREQDYTFRVEPGVERGSGKQAAVYTCRGMQDQNIYAVKLYKPQMINPTELMRVLNILETYKHPNVVNVKEYGFAKVFEQSFYYVIMELYEPLNAIQYRWKNKDDEEYRSLIVSFVSEMSAALNFLNSEHKIFHGDIKPTNIMRNPRTGKLVLIDFGGAAVPDDINETGVVAVANTAKYAAPETLRDRHHINIYSEYYSVGASLAELIDGMSPANEAAVRSLYIDVKNISLYHVPANLPSYYENLLRGLLFEAGRKDEREEYRWVTPKVSEWVKLVKANRLQEATEINKVSILENVASAVVSKAESKYDFNGTVYMDLEEDEEPITFTNLTSMADVLLNIENGYWDAGIDELLNEDTFSGVQSGVKKIIRDGVTKMQSVDSDSNNGHSINAEFFKFLFAYVSNQKAFRWKNLPQVKTAEDFAIEFQAVLERIEGENGFFGEWWKNMNEPNPIKSTIFAEIFRNRVFSFYLKRAYPENKEWLEQCKKVEAIFQNCKEHYNTEEMTEMFVFTRMITKDTSYEFSSGQLYETYQEFVNDMKSMAKDVKRAEEARQITRAVQNKNGYYPSFLAWMKM